MPIYAQSTFASHPVASTKRYSICMHTYIHIDQTIKEIMDFQNSHGPPFIIQHYVAIANMYVYMYAHICSIYFCQPPCGKQKCIKHMLAHIYTYLSNKSENHGFSKFTWSTHHNTALCCNRNHVCIDVCQYILCDVLCCSVLFCALLCLFCAVL